jgi:ACR3 family arsenite efflux pump ArsB
LASSTRGYSLVSGAYPADPVSRIILIFAEQARRILDNIGDVFRVFVPMIVYFIIMWIGTFFLVYWLSRRRGGSEKYGYKMAVVQVSRSQEIVNARLTII